MTRKRITQTIFVVVGLFGWALACALVAGLFLLWVTAPIISSFKAFKAETPEVNIPVEECTEITELISQNQEYQEDELIKPEVSLEDGVVIERKEKKELIRVKEDAIEPESKNGAVKKEKLSDLIYKKKVIEPEDQ